MSRGAVSDKQAQDDFKQYRSTSRGKSDDDSQAGLGSFGELLQRHLQDKK